MTAPEANAGRWQLWRCPAWHPDGLIRCKLLRWHPGFHGAKSDHSIYSWGRHADKRHTYETTAPWVTWLWLSTDRETRITGRSRMQLTCAVCGKQEIVRIRIPRIGPVPAPPNGIHPERTAAIQRHAHPDRGHPMSWAKPLLNWDAHPGGLSTDLLAMRLQADINERPDRPCPDCGHLRDAPQHHFGCSSGGAS